MGRNQKNNDAADEEPGYLFVFIDTHHVTSTPTRVGVGFEWCAAMNTCVFTRCSTRGSVVCRNRRRRNRRRRTSPQPVARAPLPNTQLIGHACHGLSQPQGRHPLATPPPMVYKAPSFCPPFQKATRLCSCHRRAAADRVTPRVCPQRRHRLPPLILGRPLDSRE